MLKRCLHTQRAFLRAAIFLSALILLPLYLKSIVDLSLNEEEQIFEYRLRRVEERVIKTLGNLGKPAYLEGKDKADGQEAIKQIALNTVLSDRIPLNRSLKDVRHKNCSYFKYNISLKASVIIIFFNELLSVILRTVWSVILQTPSHLLHEIILIDDCSTDQDLNGLLDYYIRTRLKDHSVHLIHSKRGLGLVRARLSGAMVATGDVLIFLDAHCEATVGWAEPLLSRIGEDRTAVVVPIIEGIDPKTLEYQTDGDDIAVGGFQWNGFFTWAGIQDPKERGKLTPVKSPTMAGGLFAIERDYFWEIGSYDEQMNGWGGENLEMSFRIWQCGGKLEAAPCSKVGHIFTDYHSYSLDAHGINTARMAHVWMDDYKRLFFMNQPQLENDPRIGDLTARRQLRQKLGCKSFKWYLDNIYPEQYVIDEEVYGSGQIRNELDMCLDDFLLDVISVGPLGLWSCHPEMSITQFFGLNFKGQLRNEFFCAEAQINMTVSLTGCDVRKRKQYWEYFVNKACIYNPLFQKCLSSRGVESHQGLILEDCSGGSFQNWTFTNLNNTAFSVH